MYKVILVDDEIWALRGMKVAFPWKAYNFEVIGEFLDGVEALDEIKRINPDVVFTDIKMADMSGLELIRKLHGKVKTEFVVVSAYRNFDYVKSSIEFDVIDYCVKPVSGDEAVRVLEKLKNKLDAKNGILLMDKELKQFGVDNLYISNKKFKRMLIHIINSYNTKLRLKDMAEQYDLNESYCTTLFKKYFDCGFAQFVNMVRVKNAAQMLRESELAVSEIAEQCGYEDYFYFIKIFKKQLGVTPNSYRNQYKTTELSKTDDNDGDKNEKNNTQ